ncbi:hypothetical protein [Mesorhizobium sp. M0522]|uniref:hypothetical protein n=1 Tax=Mesorhizobium sp. M0522 TaxID=2956958 RepID=UPI003336A946
MLSLTPAGRALLGKQRGGVSPLALFAKAATQRIDIVGIGDSNQVLSGFGWDHGFQYAMSRYFPMYATGLLSQNENNGSGSGVGYLYSRAAAGVIGAVSGAPVDLGKYLNKGSGALFPAYYTYVADGNIVGSNSLIGLVLSPNCLIDNGGALDFDLHWGSFDSGAGTFRPYVRLGQSPFTTLAVAAVPLSSNTGAFAMQRTTLSIAADPTRADKQVEFKPLRTASDGITGPYFSTYMRASNPARPNGFSYHTLEYRGGQPARTMAYDIQQASNETLTHYFAEVRRLQGPIKCVIIMVNSGLNDRNETQASVGPAAVADGDSPEAFVDNCTAIVQRIQAIWTLNGWSQDELHFVFMVSHPQSDPDDAELESYRSAILAYAATLSQGYAIDLAAKITSAQMLALGYYASAGTDKNHMTQAGYEGMGLLAVTA